MDIQDGISRSIVDAPPAHYIVRIESFSLLTKNSIERYESGKFDAGGYKCSAHASTKVTWIMCYNVPTPHRKERSKGKGESLIMMKDAIAYKQVWEINNFSKLDSECCDSKPFNAGNYKWKIKLYPKGKDAGLGSHLSLYLALADPTALSTGSKIYAQIILRILDQKQAKHHFGKANYWFSASSHENGASRFLLISNLTSQYLGYLVKDSCLVEAEVTILGVVDAFS
ncbi:TRAF-like [Sesbania bispinosa]|nr:TRAF-like [Sesbania bispinosa]